jgi:catechol 2,3-dioxygenase-like lactoylglutathione lyase family enzyme
VHNEIDKAVSRLLKGNLMKILTNICSDDLPRSKEFYQALLGFHVKYDSDWYVQLCSPEDNELEYGLIQRNHELVPEDFQNAPTGMYVTFVVKNVDDVYQKAVSMGIPIVQEPKNEFYGQRRFLVKDPSGCLLDICTPWEAE